MYFSTSWKRNTPKGTSTKLCPSARRLQPKGGVGFRSISDHDLGDSGRRHHHVIEHDKLQLAQTKRLCFASGQVEIELMQLPAKDGSGAVLPSAWYPTLGNQSSRHPPCKPSLTHTKSHRRPPCSALEIANLDRPHIPRHWGKDEGIFLFF